MSTELPTTATTVMTLQDAYTQYYLRLKLRHASDSTKYQFRMNLDRFSLFLGRPALITDLTDETVADFLAWIVNECRRAPRTANKCRDNIMALSRFLARKRVIPDYPDVEPLVEPERTPLAWTQKQLASLWKACKRAKGHIAGVPANYWWHALHCVLWDTGERVTAIMKVAWKDINLDTGFIVVPAACRKGKRSDKPSKLHPDTVAALRLIHGGGDAKVFPWTSHSTTLWTHYKKLLQSAELPCDREHKFHCMRKSAASWFEAAGGNATRLLGHSGRRVTLKYLDPRIVGDDFAAERLFRPVRSKIKREPGNPNRPKKRNGRYTWGAAGSRHFASINTRHNAGREGEQDGFAPQVKKPRQRILPAAEYAPRVYRVHTKIKAALEKPELAALTTAELARRLKVCESTIRRLRAKFGYQKPERPPLTELMVKVMDLLRDPEIRNLTLEEVATRAGTCAAYVWRVRKRMEQAGEIEAKQQKGERVLAALADPELSKLSNRALGRLTGISDTVIGEYRRKLLAPPVEAMPDTEVFSVY